MRFKAFAKTENGFNLMVLLDSFTNTTIELLPEWGASLHQFSIQVQEASFNIIDNYPTPAIAQQDLAMSFKSSKLSPFACRIDNAQYTYEGQLYEFAHKFIDGNAIHGLLYNKVFQVVDLYSDEEQASVLFKYHYKNNDPAYPFQYRCEIRYTLKPMQLLEVQTTLFNTSHHSIPIQDGWHPYFTLGNTIDQYLVQMQTAAMVVFNEKLIPTGELLADTRFETTQPFGTTQLDNCFLLKKNDLHAACTLTNPVNGLRLQIFPDASYPFLQLYTPPHRQSIAIENLSGAPDCFNNKMGLILLPAGHAQTFTVHYQASTL